MNPIRKDQVVRCRLQTGLRDIFLKGDSKWRMILYSSNLEHDGSVDYIIVEFFLNPLLLTLREVAESKL